MSSTSRRSFLQSAAGLATVSAFPAPAVAKIVPATWQTMVEMTPEAEDERRLFLKCKRTGEVFNDIYRNGILIYDDALSELDHLLRDWRRDETIQMDRKLIELLAKMQEEIGYKEPITVVSAYRTRKTNSKLRRAAKNSYHIKGMAVDLHVQGVTTHGLRKLAKKHGAGGIGYYPNRGFVHLDTGPQRSWRG